MIPCRVGRQPRGCSCDPSRSGEMRPSSDHHVRRVRIHRRHDTFHYPPILPTQHWSVAVAGRFRFACDAKRVCRRGNRTDARTRLDRIRNRRCRPARCRCPALRLAWLGFVCWRSVRSLRCCLTPVTLIGMQPLQKALIRGIHGTTARGLFRGKAQPFARRDVRRSAAEDASGRRNWGVMLELR